MTRPATDNGVWVAQVERSEAGVSSVHLLSPQGEERLHRSIESDDCDALAKAFAIILEAHFMDLGLVKPRPVEPAPQPPPVVKLVNPTAAQQIKTPRSQWVIGAGLGAAVGLPEPGATGALQLSGGLVFAETWALQFSLIAGLPQTQDEGAVDGRVRSQAVELALAGGYRFSLNDSLWIEPEGGVGGRFTHAEPLDLQAGGASSFRPSARLGLSSGLNLGKNWALRLDLLGDLLLVRDKYAVEPLGAVGAGPRSLLFLMFGVEFRGL
ncbi:MAG TPA: hypothetical protein VL137_01710 [Polyangiaceae bacterium]|nr:hypothetical protein [Polyangiaceae bacterium]